MMNNWLICIIFAWFSFGGPAYRFNYVGFRLVRSSKSLSAPLPSYASSDSRAVRALAVAREALEKIYKILNEKGEK